MRRLLVLITVAAVLASCGAARVSPSPVPSASQTASPAPSVSPSASPSTSPAPQPDHAVVYFARDRLPPVASHVDAAAAGATAEARVLSRLVALFGATAPAGTFNTTATSGARPKSARTLGDLVTVDFTVPGGDWGVGGSSSVRAFVQQIVYTATEEPGLRRALILENGAQAVIGGEGLVIDHPATRDDVLGYRTAAVREPVVWRSDTPLASAPVTSRVSVDAVSPALVRFVVDAGLSGAAAKRSLGFSASVMANDESAFPEMGKWVLSLAVPGATANEPALRVVDRTPLRTVRASSNANGVRYELGLDDLRPWRVTLLYEPLRVVVDLGGDPDAVGTNIALYQPSFGATVRGGDHLTGLIRAFEGRFEYRLRDARGTIVVDDFATASLGTSELWGTFDVPIPATLPPGAASAEILLRSPRDGEVSESVSVSFQISR